MKKFIYITDLSNAEGRFAISYEVVQLSSPGLSM